MCGSLFCLTNVNGWLHTLEARENVPNKFLTYGAFLVSADPLGDILLLRMRCVGGLDADSDLTRFPVPAYVERDLRWFLCSAVFWRTGLCGCAVIGAARTFWWHSRAVGVGYV